MKGNQHRHLALASLLGLGLVSTPAAADDIEVFLTTPSQTVAPNVLFLLDTSGSMQASDGGDTRLEVLKDSLNKVLKPQQPYKKLNVGIMNFNGDRSGGIDFPITDINSDANLVDSNIPAGTDVASVLDYIAKSYQANGNTPMGDALFFASSYFRGDKVFNTGQRWGTPNTWDTTSNSYSGGSRYADNPATYTGSTQYPTTPKTREERPCSPSSQRPIRACTASYFNCRTQTKGVPARTGSCRIQQNNRTCDSTGLECYDNWQTISETPFDGINNRPADPDGGGNGYRVICTWPRAASSYTYERCMENYSDPDATYKSPISHQCQSNYNILLTDGEPFSKDYPATTLPYIASRARDVIGSGRNQDCADLSRFGNNIATYGRCLPELVEHMATKDQSTGLPDDQTITTYTIGYELTGNPQTQDFLRLLAKQGKGEYFDVSKGKDLVDVFRKIFRDVLKDATSFTSPSVTIDQSNSLATSEYLYRPDFTPSDKPAWSGDIVKTKIDPTSATGFTDDPATLANSLIAKDRNIYTITGSNHDLAAGVNAFEVSNTNLTAGLLQLSNGVDRDKLIQWARGIDVLDEDGDQDFTEERHHMGDSLHTAPSLVHYPLSGGGSMPVLFVTTNDGLLHAFDISGSTPKERFAFIPPALLPNLDTLYRNNNTDQKVYGLDGNMSVWQNGSDVFLYFGMRRGGRNYYALDVSDLDDPKLIWTIEGGQGDFAELGQTWSTPQLTNVMVNNSKTKALIFAGGYDIDQDTLDNDPTKNVRKGDDQGRAIYVVDAETGNKIWSAGAGGDYPLALGNSIPSDVRIIDLDGNGFADRLYVGDMGGRVWRLDLEQHDITKSSGYQLADFAVDKSAADNRRFYYPPSVAFDRNHRLMIAIGSGYRAHPAETTTEDRFFVFEDRDAAIGPPSANRNALTVSNLGDITNDANGQAAYSNNHIGWYLRLNPGYGEKVLAESVIFNNKVVFTSYQPNFQASSNACQLSGNIPRAYILALADGRPVADSNKDGQYTLTDRIKPLLSVKFIPGAPYITFNKPDTSGHTTYTPTLGGDKQTADLYVGKDLIDTDSFLTDRISWENR